MDPQLSRRIAQQRQSILYRTRTTPLALKAVSGRSASPGTAKVGFSCPLMLRVRSMSYYAPMVMRLARLVVHRPQPCPPIQVAVLHQAPGAALRPPAQLRWQARRFGCSASMLFGSSCVCLHFTCEVRRQKNSIGPIDSPCLQNHSASTTRGQKKLSLFETCQVSLWKMPC